MSEYTNDDDGFGVFQEFEPAPAPAPEPAPAPAKKKTQSRSPKAMVLAGIRKSKELKRAPERALSQLAVMLGTAEDPDEIAAAIVTGSGASTRHIWDILDMNSQPDMDALISALKLGEDKPRFKRAWDLLDSFGVVEGRMPGSAVEAAKRLAAGAKALQPHQLEEIQSPLEYLS